MEDMAEALITGSVLRWARERRALDYTDVAKATKVSVEQLRQWEDGISYPPFNKAELLAKKLKIPFGFLFLSKHPSDKSPITDFRTIKGERPSDPSPDLLSVINQARTKQEWYREFSEGNGASPVSIVGSLSMESGTKAVAEAIAETLEIDHARMVVDSTPAFLSRLSTMAQDAGILVLRSGVVGAGNNNRLSVREFRGFALSDPYAPLVFINSRDAPAAQVFTLVHELAHIWINKTGVSNPDPATEAEDGVERFCNAVAAEALVPMGDFIAEWDRLENHNFFAKTLSHVFWVSPLVLILRAYETHKISDGEFHRLIRIEKAKVPHKRAKKGGNSLRTTVARNSLRLTQGVISAVRESRLVFRDAERVLGVRAGGLDALLRKFVA